MPTYYGFTLLSQVGQEENYSPQTEAALDSTGNDNTAREQLLLQKFDAETYQAAGLKLKEILNAKLKISVTQTMIRGMRGRSTMVRVIYSILELDLLLCTIFLCLWQGTFKKDT